MKCGFVFGIICMARVAMSKYKVREGRVTSKALLCLFILSKIKYKAHSGSSRTAVRFFVCSGGDENADIRNSTIIIANLLPRASKRRYIFISADSKIGSC